MKNYTLSVEWNPVFGDPKPAALRIEVSEQRLNENGWYEIVGEVTNTGSRDTALVHVIATFYDETGKLIEREFTYLTSAVPAGQSTPFKVTEFNGDKANDAESVKLTVESADYVMIGPELEQQQSLQGMQKQQQQQNDTATTATPPQVTRGAPYSEATTSGNSIGGVSDTMDLAAINKSTAQALRYIEQANTAMQNNDTQGASRNLNLALNELENIKGSLTSTAPESSGTSSTDRDNNTSVEATIPSSHSPFLQQLQSQQRQQQQQPQSQRQNQRVSVSIVPGSSTLTDDAYEPNSVIVTTGATVRWTNDDSVPHTATSGKYGTPDGRFDSGIMTPAATFEYTFTEAGEYPYFCLLHPNMVGTVTVT